MFYEKKVNRRSKEEMAKFLSGHFRYDTMSSWNRGTSYANKAKIFDLGLSKSEQDKAFSLIETDDSWGVISSDPIRNFTEDAGGNYTIGRNGRSGGYLVLYSAEYYNPGYKSCCPRCGQLNYREVTSDKDVCGVCKAPRSNLKKPLRWLRTKSSSIDQCMEFSDFMDMDVDELRSRVDLVCAFDRACDEVRERFIDMIREFYVVEETIMVPKKVLKLERMCA
jgi:hypothetical protein